MPTKLVAVRVYVTDEENDKLKKDAAEKQLTVSNHLRKKAGLKPLERGKYERNKSEGK